MKIAVIHNLPPGGAKRALQEWLKGLSKGHEIDLFTYTFFNNSDTSLDPHCCRHWKVDDLALSSGRGIFQKGSYLFWMNRVAKKLAVRINAGGYDVAFVHQCAFFQNPPVLKFLSIPTVFYSQDTPQRTLYEPGLVNEGRSKVDLAQRIKDKVNRTSIRAARRVLTSSYYTREAIEKIYGISARVVYFGIDTAKFRPLNISKGDFVLSVGRLHPTKGHDFIIHSLGLISEHKRPKLKIVCEAEQEDKKNILKALADKLGVQMQFEISISDERLVRLYNEALLTLCAYRMEPLGFVPLESLACGTPVVGVREAGLRETVREGEVGLLVDRDPQKMACAIKDLLDDRGRYQKLSENAPQYICYQWLIEKSVNEIEAHLEAVAHE